MSAERHRFGDLLSAIARLTPAQHSLLTAVSRHNVPVTVTQLAKESGLHSSSVRETIEALYNSGLVTREQLPVSGRGRPALGYLTLAPANAAFAGQLLEQSVSAMLAWLRVNASNPVEAAYDIGARWGEQAVSDNESAKLLDGPKASGLVEHLSPGRQVGFARRGGHERDRSDGDALVDDRYAEFRLDCLAHRNQIGGAPGDAFAAAPSGPPPVRVGAIQERDPHRHGPNVETVF